MMMMMLQLVANDDDNAAIIYYARGGTITRVFHLGPHQVRHYHKGISPWTKATRTSFLENSKDLTPSP
jgi:hypothetical protein